MDDGILVLSFEGSQTIEKAESVKEKITEALKSKKRDILFDLSKLEKIDLSFLQILYSAGIEAVSQKKKISIANEIPEEIKRLINLSGYSSRIANSEANIFSAAEENEE